MRLARSCGCRSVRELLAGLSREEFLELLEFERLEPSGETRADLRAGIVAALLHAGLFKDAKGEPLKFMPIVAAERERLRPPQTAADHEQILRAFAQQF